MSPRQPTKADAGSPDDLAIRTGGSSDRTYDIAQRLAGIERSIAYLEGSAGDSRRELKEIAEKISKAQGSFDTAKYFLGATCVAIWGVIAMWAKHYFGW